MIRLDSERERMDVEETQRLLFGGDSLAPLFLVEELEQRRAQADPHPFHKVPMPDLWDAQTWELAGQLNPISKAGIPLPQVSTIRVRLGRIPVLPDLRQEPTPEDRESHARREAASRAGHCGTCGDDWP